MNDTVKKIRERLLICPVCRDEYKDPRLIPCYHTLCYTCLCSLIRATSVMQRFINCPICRFKFEIPADGVEKLPANFYILNMVDELNNSVVYDGECEVCETNKAMAEFRCVDCDKDVCRYHIHSHCINFHADKPKIMRIERTVTESSNLLPSNKFCPFHKDQRVTLYCLSCETPICVSCSCGLGLHNTHQLISLSDHLRGFGPSMKKDLDALSVDSKNLNAALKLIEITKTEVVYRSNKSVLDLDKAATEACNAIHREKSALEKTILESEKADLRKLDTMKFEITGYLQGIEKGQYYLSNLKSEDLCLEAVETFNDFSQDIKKRRKQISKASFTINRKRLYEGQFGRSIGLPVGCNRKDVFYWGTLGSLKSDKRYLRVDYRTMIARKDSYRFPRLFKWVFVPIFNILCHLFGSVCLMYFILLVYFWFLDETVVGDAIEFYVHQLVDGVKDVYLSLPTKDDIFMQLSEQIPSFFQKYWSSDQNADSQD